MGSRQITVRVRPKRNRLWPKSCLHSRDIVRFDLNDRINLTDIGVAILRSFDMASYKKDVLHEIRKTRQVPAIPQFWRAWLHQLSCAVRTIEESLPRSARTRRQ